MAMEFVTSATFDALLAVEIDFIDGLAKERCSLLGAFDTWAQWLQPAGEVLLAIMLILLCTIAWAANLVTLPGNWFAVAVLAGYAWWGPDSGRVSMGPTPVAIAFGFALCGEIIELVAGAMGAQRAGASTKSTVYAVIGSMIGALVGAVIGIPVPIFGSLLAAVLFGGLGAMVGAIYGEWTNDRPWKETWSIGHAAFWGRTVGTLGKMAAGLGILLVAAIAVVI